MVARLEEAFLRASQQPKFLSYLASLGEVPASARGAALSRDLRREFDELGALEAQLTRATSDAESTLQAAARHLVSAGGKRISASAIDWSAGVPRIGIRQPPGNSNALGHIKFMFPNDFSVYLHDTSSRGLFASERRAFSHGCVRVDLPFRLAEIVMGAENGWTEERVRNSIGGGERRVDLKDQVAVHIAYFTAKVDENGELKTFEDIYGIDRRVLDLLGS